MIYLIDEPLASIHGVIRPSGWFPISRMRMNFQSAKPARIQDDMNGSKRKEKCKNLTHWEVFPPSPPSPPPPSPPPPTTRL